MDTPKDENPGATNTWGFQELTTDQSNTDSTRAQTEKQEATLFAALALRGHAAHALRSGGYLVCHHAYSTTLASLDALQAFARRVGAV